MDKAHSLMNEGPPAGWSFGGEFEGIPVLRPIETPFFEVSFI